MDKIQTLVAFKNDMLQLGLKTRILAKLRSVTYAHLRQLKPQLVLNSFKPFHCQSNETKYTLDSKAIDTGIIVSVGLFS